MLHLTASALNKLSSSSSSSSSPLRFPRACFLGSFLLHDEDGVAGQSAPLANGIYLLVRARLDVDLHQQMDKVTKWTK
jgi:hypothetical protein